MLLAHSPLQFTHHLPYGAIIHDHGVQFVVFSRRASTMRVLLYEQVNDREPSEIIRMDPELNRWGHVWSLFVPGIAAGQLYHFQCDGPFDPAGGHRFESQARLIDPYAKALAGDFQPPIDGVLRPPKCVVVDDTFDWRDDRHIRRSLAESVIYEMHVGGFTKGRNANVEHPGTYLGVIDKIPYLKSLGVTAVELMPVHEFPIKNILGQPLERPNYWGYDPLAWFSPHRGYASEATPGVQVREFKKMVCELHKNGIEVILDVVFNHSAEGNHLGPNVTLKGLENSVYYMLDDDGGYKNYSGCGNTVNGNHPVVRELIFNCLRHWVHNYHVDGFRFDLASILNRDRKGNLVPNPPLVEAIAEDPMLADTKIIAEAWDAAGAYQVGSFADSRWAEWNGRYRDDVRKFWRGDWHTLGALATRLAGSSDLYESSGREPFHSINFITSHDGFPLGDLVTYNDKHNEANGEGNRDGDNHNLSYNYGVEGPSHRKPVKAVRNRQVKNFLATMMVSHGVPMLLMGDECRRTQGGNNNAYCQDNETSWFDWQLVKNNKQLVRFATELIRFRKENPVVRRPKFLSGEAYQPGKLIDVMWFGPEGGAPDWDGRGQSLVYVQGAQPHDAPPKIPGAAPITLRHVMVMVHSGLEPQQFVCPALIQPITWRLAVDTAAESPDDVHPNYDGPEFRAGDVVELESRSLRIYVCEAAL